MIDELSKHTNPSLKPQTLHLHSHKNPRLIPVCVTEHTSFMEIMQMKLHAALTCQSKVTATCCQRENAFTPSYPQVSDLILKDMQLKVLRGWSEELKFLPPVATEHLCLCIDSKFMALESFSGASPWPASLCCSGGSCLCVSLSVPRGKCPHHLCLC